MFNKHIIIGTTLITLGIFFIAHSYYPASYGGFTDHGAYFTPGLLSLGILLLIPGGITLAKGIKEYFRK